MAFETGTATDFLDLFDRLSAFIADPLKGAWERPADHPEISSSTGFSQFRSSDSEAWKLFSPLTEDAGTFSNEAYVQFQLVTEITLKALKLTMPSLSGGGTIAASPKDFELYESSDGISWNLLKLWSGELTWTDLETRTFNLDANHQGKWFKFVFKASNSGTTCRLATIELIKSDDSLHYVYATSRTNSYSVAQRALFRSTYSAGGVYAHVSLRTLINAESKIYSIGIAGGSHLDYPVEEGSDLVWADLLNPSSYSYAYLWDAPMEYWFYGDYRQVYAAVRVGSTIQSFGFGYHLAYATPQQYQLPMFVGASNSSPTYTWENDNRGDIRSFTNPGNGSLFFFSPENAWLEAQNYIHGSSGEELSPNANCLWPGNLAAYNSLRNAPGDSDTNGNFILYPLCIKKSSDSIYGELKNIFLVPSLNLTSGDTILIDGDDYTVFQNCWRTSQQDYFAIKEE